MVLRNKGRKALIKDGAYFCYCAYILHISRYSGFLWVVPTNTGIFLCSLKLCGESRTYQGLLVSRKKIGGITIHFAEIMKLQFGKNRHTLLCILLLFRIIVALLSLKKRPTTPNFLSGFQ